MIKLESNSKEYPIKSRVISNSSKPSSLVRFYPNSSTHKKKIRISKSKVLFYYLTKSLWVAKPISKKITRPDKTSSLSPSLIKTSTTSKFRKSTHIA